MRTKTAAILLCSLFTAASAFAQGFDALGAAPKASPTPENEDKRFQARMAESIRLTYHRLEQVYTMNHNSLTETRTTFGPSGGAKIGELTPAQLTEVITVQWQIYNILKSINPSMTLPTPPSDDGPKVVLKPATPVPATSKPKPSLKKK